MAMITMVHDNHNHSDENNTGHCHLYCEAYDVMMLMIMM
jgi:hypothetical protein